MSSRSRPTSLFLLTLTVLLLSAILLLGIVLWVGSTRLIVPNRQALEERHYELLADPARYGMDLRPFEIRTHDGHELVGIVASRAGEIGEAARTRAMEDRLLARGLETSESARGTIILHHGRGGRKEDMLTIAQRFVAANYRCVVYDARAHGKSGGQHCTFGKEEVQDLNSVLNLLKKDLQSRGESTGPVGLFGISLGGAVVLQSVAQATEVQAVVAVAPFANLPEIVNLSGQRMIHRHLPAWISRGAMRVGGWRGRFDPFAIIPEESAASSTTPLFVVHGTLDGVIPIEHGRRIYERSAASAKQWSEIPTGYHGNVLAEGGDDLYEKMVLFFLAHLTPSRSSDAAETSGLR